MDGLSRLRGNTREQYEGPVRRRRRCNVLRKFIPLTSFDVVGFVLLVGTLWESQVGVVLDMFGRVVWMRWDRWMAWFDL